MSPARKQHVLQLILLLVTGAWAVAGCGGNGSQAAADAEGIVISNVGFMTPESVLADTVADVYLVSNINGSPTDEDNNGFISRVTPDGQVENLKWIDGESPFINLNAPKGMAIRGDSLFVADINCVRIFHRVSGESEGRICVEGATFLNDVAIGPEGSLFVTDSGLRAGAGGFESTGTDAVYRLALEEGRRHTSIARSAQLGAPNGIAVGSRGIFVVTFNAGDISAYTAAGEKTQVMPPSNRQLDGIVLLPGGGFLFSSWTDSAVYRVDSQRRVQKIATVPSPADIGFDPKRNRVLIPVFLQNEVRIVDLPPEG